MKFYSFLIQHIVLEFVKRLFDTTYSIKELCFRLQFIGNVKENATTAFLMPALKGLQWLQ